MLEQMSYIVVITMFMGMLGYTQNYSSQIKSAQKLNRENLFLEQIILNRSISQLETNNIFLKQIGESNISKIQVDAVFSQVNAVQQGNENTIEIDFKGIRLTENIIQIGNHNTYKDLQFFNASNRAIDVYQQGDNQKIMLYGQNKLSEKLKIKQRGNDKELIIYNFN